MKIIFLDIDGVLNSYRSDLIYGHEKEVENLDPVAVKLIKKLVGETGSIICLSSDWRLYHDYMELGKQLKLPILFETNHSEDEYRVNQIQEVLDAVNPESYVILDDHEDDHEFDGMNWVNVGEEDGFGYKDYVLAKEFLNKKGDDR